MASDASSPAERRVLLLAPTRKDAELTRALLVRAGLDCIVCPNMAKLLEGIAAGVAAVLLVEDAITAPDIRSLANVFEAQPPWSDIPVIVLIQGGSASPSRLEALQALRNVTLLERPAPMRSVLSAVQAAVRARGRQYEIRDQFAAVRGAQAKATQLQQQLEIALEASELGTFHCEMPLSHIEWNPQCKAHFFLPPDAIIDFEVFYGRLHPDDRDRARAAVEACVYQGKRYDIEYRVISPQGQMRWIRATGRTYYDEFNRPLRFDGTTRDVTAQRLHAEDRERLLQSEQAARAEVERTSRLKDEFLATLSHELRTPLNAILGWSQLLRREAGDPEALAEGLSVIERNARVQTQLIEDLLDMSRIISGKVRLDVQSVSADSFINAAIQTVEPSARARGVSIQKILDDSAGPIAGDPARLQQIIWNLLSNAIKFTPRGGRVQVLLQRIESHMQISVSDTGEGIAPEFLPYVFERFRQADASTTRKHGGLGLGLSIVKQLVELHGGSIRAQSPGPGLGSTFIVSLPRVVIHHVLTPEPPAPARPTGSPLLSADCAGLDGLRVLVVDDEPHARTLIRKLLEDCDAPVFTAS